MNLKITGDEAAQGAISSSDFSRFVGETSLFRITPEEGDLIVLTGVGVNPILDKTTKELKAIELFFEATMLEKVANNYTNLVSGIITSSTIIPTNSTMLRRDAAHMLKESSIWRLAAKAGTIAIFSEAPVIKDGKIDQKSIKPSKFLTEILSRMGEFDEQGKLIKGTVFKAGAKTILTPHENAEFKKDIVLIPLSAMQEVLTK